MENRLRAMEIMFRFGIGIPSQVEVTTPTALEGPLVVIEVPADEVDHARRNLAEKYPGGRIRSPLVQRLPSAKVERGRRGRG